MPTEFESGCLSNVELGQPQRPGQSEARRHAEPVDTGGIRIRSISHEEDWHDCEPCRSDGETVTKQKVEQLMSIMGYEFLENDKSLRKNRPTRAR